jgi:hypothetical protein
MEDDYRLLLLDTPISDSNCTDVITQAFYGGFQKVLNHILSQLKSKFKQIQTSIPRNEWMRANYKDVSVQIREEIWLTQ